jgi:hypothetical protein
MPAFAALRKLAGAGGLAEWAGRGAAFQTQTSGMSRLQIGFCFVHWPLLRELSAFTIGGLADTALP